MRRWVLAALLGVASACALAQSSVLLVAKPGMLDPNFRETVVLVTRAPDASTVGVILNRPTSARNERTGEPLYSGGPVMPRTLVALFYSAGEPAGPSLHVLKGIYLSMHPEVLERLAPPFRLYAGSAGWAPGQLESELRQDAWHVLPASEELVFRRDTSGLWRELVERAGARRTRSENVTNVAIRL